MSFAPGVGDALLETLRQLKVDLAEYWILSELGNAPMPPAMAMERAKRISGDMDMTDGEWAVSADQVERALSALIERGLVRVVDAAAQEEIRCLVESRCGDVIGPIYGIPRLELLDVTLLGGAVIKHLRTDVFGWDDDSPVSDGWKIDENTERAIGKTRDEALYIADELVSEETSWNDDPSNWSYDPSSAHSIGRWCVNWWCVYPKGWEVVVTRTTNVE